MAGWSSRSSGVSSGWVGSAFRTQGCLGVWRRFQWVGRAARGAAANQRNNSRRPRLRGESECQFSFLRASSRTRSCLRTPYELVSVMNYAFIRIQRGDRGVYHPTLSITPKEFLWKHSWRDTHLLGFICQPGRDMVRSGRDPDVGLSVSLWACLIPPTRGTRFVMSCP